ncbi:WD repeat-containing protein on Y chromosome [Nephila pilipes]|uniref:WD repeat-containing protein on Y chromosome n=1 Tax=Nephila pilipes TaxID=299642 RepID=A0A8X6T912_NEPPI|nr:WD repeat-containing protein on Y chromosome [Nephila pilipes]
MKLLGPAITEDCKDYPAKLLVKERKNSSISQILILQNREMEESIGNLVSCGIDGRIRFWNIICVQKVNKWQLLSKFRAVFRECDGVLCIATDRENKFLFSGDTMGYIRIYDLEDYYSLYGSIPSNAKNPKIHHYEKYPFLRLQRLIQANHSQHSKFDADGGRELGFAPLLLNCFRAHMGAILKIEYSNEKEMIVTAARQGSVRLWTISGIYVGHFGSETADVAPKIKRMPPDIQVIASPLTLHVFNNGRKPYWERAMKALNRCRLGYTFEKTEEQPFAWIKEKEIVTKKFSEEFTLHRELEKRLPSFPGTTALKLQLHKVENIDVKEK